MVYCEKMNKQKIAEQLKHMDNLLFELRMAVTALQREFHQSVTVSTDTQPGFITGRDLGDEQPEQSMKKCFICDGALTGRNGTSLFKEQRGAHVDCMWRIAELVINGEQYGRKRSRALGAFIHEAQSK